MLRLFKRAKALLAPEEVAPASPEETALAQLREMAGAMPRYTLGCAEVMGLRIAFGDIGSVPPQWADIFVRQTLKFTCDSPAPRILDCGANVGLATLYFKSLYPAARVTAYEADPKLHEYLRRNLSANGAGDVEVVHAAVWTETGEVAFRPEGGDSGAIQHFSVIADSARDCTVPAVRLRDVLEREPVDLLKLDVEGAEIDLLKDCAGSLRDVKAIIVELHETDPARRMTPEVLQMLEQAGFRYTLEDLHMMRWRSQPTPATHRFPGRELRWVVLARAWKE
jgi:FkbM family methyltransferase